MELKVHQERLRDVESRNRRLSLVVLMMGLTLLLAMLSIISVIGRDRVVVVPPNLTKSFWVTSTKASPDYLEQMAAFVSWLILDVSPATIEWKSDILLSYVAPKTYGPLKSQQQLEAQRLKRLNASTYFQPQQLVVDEARQSVVVRGRLRTQINGADTTSDLKAYSVTFDFAGGRVHLESFKELAYDTQPGEQMAAAGSADR